MNRGCAQLLQAAMVMLALASGMLSTPAEAADTASAPNIVLIVADDLGWAGLPSYGNKITSTPNIDALVRQGLRFTRFYAQPVCSPSRAELQSGRNPARFGLTDFIPGHWRPFERVITPRPTLAFPTDVPTLATVLRARGYATGYFGKWHLGENKVKPADVGYDESLVGIALNHVTDTGVPTTQTIGDKASAFVERHRRGPFFLMLSPSQPHVPLRAEGAKIRKYQARLAEAQSALPDPTYAAMIEDLDDLVGRIMRKLDELQLADSTLLMFVSDNGGLEHLDLGLDQRVTSNAPLRGEKGTIYEGGIRVPMIVRWPSGVRIGNEDVPATLADLLPTVLDLAGAPDSGKSNFDGRSLARVFNGRPGDLAERALYIHYPHYHHGRPASAVLLGRWKLIEFLDDGAIELYDVVDDIGERRDQARRHPAIATKLKRMLASWRREVGASMPQPNPDYDPARAAEWWDFESKQPISTQRFRKILAPGELQSSQASPGVDVLATGFADPPSSARPRVWWHWMNGNVTQDGIRKDLEWMARIGIGGVQNFDAALSTPQVVAKRLAYMTPEWQQTFKFTATMADQLGLELAIAASPGWSETGGPWVEPKDGMKKLVWSETLLEGGPHFSGRLPAPPATTGAFQSLGKAPGIADFLSSGPKAPLPAFYEDVAVIAYRLSESNQIPVARIRSASGQMLDAALLVDDSYASGADVLVGTPQEPGFVTIDYPESQTIRSLSLRAASGKALEPNVLPSFEASQDGKAWRKIVDVPLTFVPTTVSFAPVTAQHFRLVLNAAPVSRGASFGGAPGAVRRSPAPDPETMKLTELRLRSDARVNRFEVKAAFSIAPDYYALDANVGPDVQGVDADSIIDLTRHVAADGRLDWTPPDGGQWSVLRFGYSLTGAMNHPATAEATGLEVDKYDGRAVRRYMNTYLRKFSEITGPALIGERGLRAIVTDSIETGASNWTGDMIAQFQRLRGYDPRPWMHALAGVIVGSRSQSDAFLYDFRRTLAELIASEHYAQVAATAREQGLTVYGEALELGRPVIGDDLDMRRHADVPMAACWTYPLELGVHPTFLADMKGAASVAHIYGQNLVAAESLTSGYSPWAHAPADLKRVIDLEFSQGINRPVIHTSVHQPVDDKIPGLSLSFFGQYFTRHETWAEMARPWIDYIARNSFMLQQGRNVADVAYFYGQEAPLTSLYRDQAVADAPVRYAYDFVNADAVLNRLSVSGNELITPSGARYAVLYLGGSSKRMTLELLRKLAALAEEGATIVGSAPVSSPSLKDDAGEFSIIVRRLWSGSRSTAVGKGRVVATDDVESALRDIEVMPDFSFSPSHDSSQILFVHRRLADGDIYFLNNRKARAERTQARFRVVGKRPEIWRADRGAAEPVSYRIESGSTVVPLEFLPEDSYFVVFREPANEPAVTVEPMPWKRIGKIEGSWHVMLQPGRGAPSSVHMDGLKSLSAHSDPGIKYFSGVARYFKSFDLPSSAQPGAPLMLDLGAVGDVAEVWLNGKLLGTVWKPPYRIEIGSEVRRGKNELEIRVANLWINRLIGDAQPEATKIAFTTVPTYSADAPLRASGLLGPVSISGR